MIMWEAAGRSESGRPDTDGTQICENFKFGDRRIPFPAFLEVRAFTFLLFLSADMVFSLTGRRLRIRVCNLPHTGSVSVSSLGAGRDFC